MCEGDPSKPVLSPLPRSRWVWLGWPFVWLIVAYQHSLGHVMGGRCRFYPSCSHYGLQAFRVHAPWTAFVLTARRLLRCHPWGGSGVDPVPPLRVSQNREDD